MKTENLKDVLATETKTIITIDGSIMKKIAALASVCLLAGCSVANVKELREHASLTSHLEINENYQRVYKYFLEKLKECYWLDSHGVSTTYEIYNELREAEISIFAAGPLYNGYYFHADIDAIDDNKTSVNLYSYLRTWTSLHGEIEKWVTDPDAEC